MSDLIDGRHDVVTAFVAALNHCGPVSGDPAPDFRQVAEGLRRCAALADFLAEHAS